MDLQENKLWFIEYGANATIWLEANTIEEAIENFRYKFKKEKILKITIGPSFYRKISK